VATVDPAVAAETAPAHRAPGRPRSAQADRAIIDAIVDLLVNRGYREVTIEAVAARAGVAKTTIYRRWPSKAEMVVEAISACKKDCLEVESCTGTTVACTLVGTSPSTVIAIVPGRICGSDIGAVSDPVTPSPGVFSANLLVIL